MNINVASKEILCRVVYYGTGQGGKTTNLEKIHSSLPEEERGSLVAFANKEDRTLFFDMLSIGREVDVSGRPWNVRIQLLTVPGQVYYNATRSLVLRGVDALVFVADSNPLRREANRESVANLYMNLANLAQESGNADYDPKNLGHDLPLVIQYNKRDHSGAMPLEQMQEDLNPEDVPAYQAIAIQGVGVQETMNAVIDLLIKKIERQF